MYNPDHLGVLRQGKDAWNGWRIQTPTIVPNLEEAPLAGTDLADYDFSCATLASANLRNANVDGARFTGCNLQLADFRGTSGLGAPMLAKAVNVPLAHYDVELVVELKVVEPEHAEEHSSRLAAKNLASYKIAGYNLMSADLDGWCLDGADLRDCLLAKARLRSGRNGKASLKSALLSGTLLSGCDFSGADLRGAVFRFAVLRHARLIGADLTGADLRMADLEGCDIKEATCRNVIYAWQSDANEFRRSRHYVLAWFSDDLAAELELGSGHFDKLKVKDLSGCDLRGADLSGATFNNLSGSDCSNADLRNAKLADAKLTGTILTNAKLDGCVLERASLTNADLRGASLLNVNFRHADLRNADLSDALLEGADLEDANLQQANLCGAVRVNGDPGSRIHLDRLKNAKNCALAIHSADVLEKLNLKQGLKVDEHRNNVEHRDFEGYSFAALKLEDADLKNGCLAGTNFQKTRLKNADLSGADMRCADCRGAVLVHADMQNSVLDGAVFRDADLHDANLLGAQGLLAEQLAATDLTGAKISADIAAFNSIGNIKEVSTSARNVFISMLALSAYTWLQMMATRDRDLLVDSSAIAIPLLQIQVTAATFYRILPALLLCLFIWCHFYLQHLWEELAQLPGRLPDGRPLYRRVYPWLLNSMVSIHFPVLKKDRPFFTHLQILSGALLAWWIVPATIAMVWWRYIPRHEFLTSSYHVAAMAFALMTGLLLQNLAGATLRGVVRRPFDSISCLRNRSALLGNLGFLASVALLLAITWACIQPATNATGLRAALGRAAAARISGADLSVQAPAAKGGSAAGSGGISGVYLPGRNLRWVKAEGAILSSANLSAADLQAAHLEGAHLQQADLRGADLRFAQLTDADLRNADLRGARLSHADFSGAKLDGCDLRGVDLGAVIGLQKSQIESARTDAKSIQPF